MVTVKKHSKNAKEQNFSACPILVKVCNFESFCFLINCVTEKRNNSILFPKLFWPTVRKKMFYWLRKTLKFEAEGWAYFKKKKCSNSKRSVQFLKQNAFLTCSWRFLRPNILEQLEFKLEKFILDFETYRERYKIEIPYLLTVLLSLPLNKLPCHPSSKKEKSWRRGSGYGRISSLGFVN